MALMHVIVPLEWGRAILSRHLLPWNIRHDFKILFVTPGISRRTFRDRLPKTRKQLNRYRPVDHADGVKCRIEGPRIGVLERVVYRYKAGLQAAHNARLL